MINKNNENDRNNLKKSLERIKWWQFSCGWRAEEQTGLTRTQIEKVMKSE